MADDLEVNAEKIEQLKDDLEAAKRARTVLHDRVREQGGVQSIQQLVNLVDTPEIMRRDLKRLLACLTPESEGLIENSPGAGGAQSRTAETQHRSKRARPTRDL
mmetsp:Transcript_44996/g.103848  ORF Transcript_44996/g.103848 Transcript_44996/m.103848 type:complete len:104 (-) Transcript_44996:185-496(-)